VVLFKAELTAVYEQKMYSNGITTHNSERALVWKEVSTQSANSVVKHLACRFSARL